LVADGDLARFDDLAVAVEAEPARQLLLEAVPDHHIGTAEIEATTGVDRYTLARGFRTRFGTSPHRT
jgi:AraC-like DNA-binding protein